LDAAIGMYSQLRETTVPWLADRGRKCHIGAMQAASWSGG
jgi:hypothetical protein